MISNSRSADNLRRDIRNFNWIKLLAVDTAGKMWCGSKDESIL